MGKFGGDNVWKKWLDEDFGKKLWRMNGLAKMLLIGMGLSGPHTSKSFIGSCIGNTYLF